MKKWHLPLPCLLLLLLTENYGQDLLNGHIYQLDFDPYLGIVDGSVYLQDQGTSCVSDHDGLYQIALPTGPSRLTYKYAATYKIELEPRGASKLDVYLGTIPMVREMLNIDREVSAQGPSEPQGDFLVKGMLRQKNGEALPHVPIRSPDGQIETISNELGSFEVYIPNDATGMAIFYPPELLQPKTEKEAVAAIIQVFR